MLARSRLDIYKCFMYALYVSWKFRESVYVYYVVPSPSWSVGMTGTST